MATQAHSHMVETHEQFLQRASKFFPVDASQSWSPFERAIFNSLMAKLIFQRSYNSISDEMLLAAKVEMQEIVRRCSPTTPLPHWRYPATVRGQQASPSASQHA